MIRQGEGMPGYPPERRDRDQLLPPPFLPPPPARVSDMDVPEHLLVDIALRHVYINAICDIHTLARVMKLTLEVAETIFRRMTEQHFFEVRRTAGDDFVFSLTAEGKKLALERGETVRYSGPAPVSHTSWAEMVRRQAVYPQVSRDGLREAFSDIVLADEIIDLLGPALISQGSIFLYGPSGTGKTTIAERMVRIYQDTVLIPWAIEIEGRIVILVDPAIHEPVEFEGLEYDRRWCICRRPFLAAGGELVASMLDLQRDDTTGVYIAPLQMKANNGILLIDDFGRQLMSVRDLMNRWIVPLDRRVDYLSMGNGKFNVPFELLVVFSTNLEPHELGDEAFLRRVANKILIAGIDAERFDAIFHLTAAAAELEVEPGIEARFRDLCVRYSGDLRPCFPRDICRLIRAIAIYEGRKPEINLESLERAVSGYFVVDVSK